MWYRSRLVALLAPTLLIGTIVHAQPTAQFAWRALNGPFGGTAPVILEASDGTLFAGSGGNEGGVYRSLDGGLTWQRSSAGIPLADRSVDAIVEADSGHILIGTNSHIGSRFYRSKDGGGTWTEQVNLGCLAFAKTPEGHILAANTAYGAMHRSTDNGYTWDEVAMPLGWTDDIAVNDSGHVFVGGWGFSRSRDGGQTWKAMGVGGVRSIAVDRDGRVYAGNWGEYASNSGVFRSDDNGETWAPVKLGFRVNAKRNIAFTPEGHILVGSWGQGIWKSTDDGATWYQANTGLGHLNMRHLQVTADGIVFAGTEGGGMYRSGDGGERWTQVGLTAARATRLAFSPATGDLFAVVVGVARSSDGGETWVPVNTGITNMDLRSIAIAPDGTLYAGGAGLVYRSDDNGDTWTPAGSGIADHTVGAVGIAPDGTVYAANYYGIYESTDRGDSWTQVDGFSSGVWIVFNEAGDLFAGSWGQGIVRRLNGQETWGVLNAGTPWVSALYVGRNGFVYANNGRSEDNGDTWAAMGYSNYVAGFVENSIGQLFAATSNFGGGIHRSTNKGVTWERVNSGIPTDDARAITVDADDYLYVAAYGHSVYKTVLPTTVSTGVEDDPATPGSFRLEQNYPNPFNPATTLRFALPRASKATLTVQNVLGQEIATLIAGDLAAGVHEVRWDATGLPSGVYLYRLEAGPHRQTRKLVLLR